VRQVHVRSQIDAAEISMSLGEGELDWFANPTSTSSSLWRNAPWRRIERSESSSRTRFEGNAQQRQEGDGQRRSGRRRLELGLRLPLKLNSAWKGGGNRPDEVIDFIAAHVRRARKLDASIRRRHLDRNAPLFVSKRPLLKKLDQSWQYSWQ